MWPGYIIEIGFLLVLLGFTGFSLIFLGLTGFSPSCFLSQLGFTSFSELQWVGTGFLCLFSRLLPSFFYRFFYRVLPSFLWKRNTHQLMDSLLNLVEAVFRVAEQLNFVAKSASRVSARKCGGGGGGGASCRRRRSVGWVTHEFFRRRRSDASASGRRDPLRCDEFIRRRLIPSAPPKKKQKEKRKKWGRSRFSPPFVWPSTGSFLPGFT